MADRALAHTGAIVAFLNQRDRWHHLCVNAFSELRFPLLTTEAVLTEVFHLIEPGRRTLEKAWEFLNSGAFELGVIDTSALPMIAELMHRYSDRPMDFADATLVHLANREGISMVFTIDHDDFETYRIAGTRRFRIVPDRKP